MRVGMCGLASYANHYTSIFLRAGMCGLASYTDHYISITHESRDVQSNRSSRNSTRNYQYRLFWRSLTDKHVYRDPLCKNPYKCIAPGLGHTAGSHLSSAHHQPIIQSTNQDMSMLSGSVSGGGMASGGENMPPVSSLACLMHGMKEAGPVERVMIREIMQEEVMLEGWNFDLVAMHGQYTYTPEPDITTTNAATDTTSTNNATELLNSMVFNYEDKIYLCQHKICMQTAGECCCNTMLKLCMGVGNISWYCVGCRRGIQRSIGYYTHSSGIGKWAHDGVNAAFLTGTAVAGTTAPAGSSSSSSSTGNSTTPN
ncbi:hypothetical protein DACRYDRAFT_18927 [Dacryopinax primogenitus]|uniref:Uncharacterized protein n=1 Tax=Dacryopinax primogenitus (strain DJM 731) TaxID=1858805 RepID=M5FQZ3_DACPD|nr:uncharacterized protein DACRYDRAFT_18927 [Dacryopinax primogenitus]EJT97224.1 hypothetical protein DACRYDRAFT_18927 [Dacryopinax primogenitus]